MPHDVFISYSSRDKSIADAVCGTLEGRHIRCWIAPRDILPGMEYGEALVNAISECYAFVLIFSSGANDSPQVKREVERAVSKSKVILPFRIEDIIPTKAMEFALSNTHWLDALTPPLQAHIETLSDTILRLLNRKHNGGDSIRLGSVSATSLFLFGYYSVQCLLSRSLPTEQEQAIYIAMRQLDGIQPNWVSSVQQGERSALGLYSVLQSLGMSDVTREGQIVWLGVSLKSLDNTLAIADRLPATTVSQSKRQCDDLFNKLKAPQELLLKLEQSKQPGQIDDVVSRVLSWLAKG